MSHLLGNLDVPVCGRFVIKDQTQGFCCESGGAGCCSFACPLQVGDQQGPGELDWLIVLEVAIVWVCGRVGLDGSPVLACGGKFAEVH